MDFAVKRLPIGIEFFDEMIKNQYYYVDKTGMISELLRSGGKVTLFTRPRRFGKSLNMSMLKNFFSLQGDKRIFNELQISRDKQVCEEYMGKFPVISISLKSVDGFAYRDAYEMLCATIGNEAMKFQYLMDSTKLTDREKEQYGLLIKGGDRIPFEMDEVTLTGSLKTLSLLLEKHHGKQTVLLIDEYDVPLDKAFQHGYYKEMVHFIRGLLGEALKTNDSLSFAVLTGCLRVSKESIFTGLNNFKILSITDTRFDEQFGFTDTEVRKLLLDYHLEDRFEEVKEWYDGYRFGNADVYCPWDVINFVDRAKDDKEAKPEAYWINTSGNDLVKRFIDKANKTTKNEIERLINGEAIEKELRLDLTYEEVDQSIENLWSVLFTTGYLTQSGRNEDGAYRLIIPNREVREVFRLQINEWFKKSIFSNTERLTAFWKAFEEGDTEGVEQYLNRVLSNSISVFDTKARKEEKESSYHNLLVGILTGNADWLVKSNVEAGEGFADIIVETDDPDAGIVAELKYTKNFDDMKMTCQKAIAQIRDRRYQEYLLNDDRKDIRLYGITFCKKRCCAISEKL